MTGRDPDIVFDYLGRETFTASVWLAARGGSVVTCGSSTGYWHEFDNRHLWMKVKRIIGSHGCTYHEAVQTNRLIELGMVTPTLSRTYALEDVPRALRAVQLNEHVGKVGVRCLVPVDGLGVTDPRLRSRIGEERIGAFRRTGHPAGRRVA
jgi:crotonyl-CoA reductase